MNALRLLMLLIGGLLLLIGAVCFLVRMAWDRSGLHRRLEAVADGRGAAGGPALPSRLARIAAGGLCGFMVVDLFMFGLVALVAGAIALYVAFA
jgi:hypothetical protein